MFSEQTTVSLPIQVEPVQPEHDAAMMVIFPGSSYTGAQGPGDGLTVYREPLAGADPARVAGTAARAKSFAYAVALALFPVWPARKWCPGPTGEGVAFL